MTNQDPAIETLKERGWREVAAIDQALTAGQINEEEWHQAMASLIKPAYLSAQNPYAQAGHGGDASTWESSRGFIAQALHQNGSFLDVGCANGILMESVSHWGVTKGLKIEPYGLDIIPEFVELAQSRLPHWADRIYLGNIRNWHLSDRRFDYVLLRPGYAPKHRRGALIKHVLNHVLKSGGRLIVFVGAEEKELRSVEENVTESGITVDGRIEIPHTKDSRLVRRLFWIDDR